MTILEASRAYGLSRDTLRYYERIGLIPPVHKNERGIRDYTEEDCKWIEFSKCMRAAGLSIEVLIEYVRLFHMGDETIEARRRLLVEQRELLAEKMAEMQGTLGRLDYKIKNYDTVLIPKLKAQK